MANHFRTELVLRALEMAAVGLTSSQTLSAKAGQPQLNVAAISGEDLKLDPAACLSTEKPLTHEP